jgi:hypothetical protein
MGASDSAQKSSGASRYYARGANKGKYKKGGKKIKTQATQKSPRTIAAQRASAQGSNFDKEVIRAVKENLCQTDKQITYTDLTRKHGLAPVVAHYIHTVTKKWGASITRSQVNGCKHPYEMRRTKKGIETRQTANVEDVLLIRRNVQGTPMVGLAVSERKLKACTRASHVSQINLMIMDFTSYTIQSIKEAECVVYNEFAAPKNIGWKDPLIKKILQATYCIVYITYGQRAAMYATKPMDTYVMWRPFYSGTPSNLEKTVSGADVVPHFSTLVPADSEAGKAIIEICTPKKRTASSHGSTPKPPKRSTTTKKRTTLSLTKKASRPKTKKK